MSECARHDAESVWAHIIPVMEYVKSITLIDTLHFVADSPSSQYRNRNSFRQHDNSELFNTGSVSEPIKKSPRSPKVTFLSDIRLDWSNTAFYGYSGSTHKNSIN